MVLYCRPQTVDEALDLLREANGNGRVLVGGTDLLVHVRRQPVEPLVLVDLKTVGDLPPAIEVTEDGVSVGPTGTMADLVSTPEVVEWYPSLVAAANVVGSVAIRNRATLVGNICNASPACDTAPSLLLHNASVTIRGADGDRTLPIGDFFEGPGKTACTAGELVIRIDIPKPADGYRCAFQRLTRRRGVDLATVNAAAGVSADGVVSIALGAVAPTPVKAEAADAIDVTDAGAVQALAEQLTNIASPISDVRATKEYRRAMTTVLAVRAINDATGLEAS